MIEMRIKLAIVIAVASALLSATAAFAHHAFAAEFDAKKPVKLRGTVSKMEWINPHAWIHVDVKDTNGAVVNWMMTRTVVIAWPRRLFCRRIDGCFSRQWREFPTSPRYAGPVRR